LSLVSRLLASLSEKLSVLGSLSGVLLSSSLLEGKLVSLSLKSLRGDESLDPRCLGLGDLGSGLAFLRLDLSSNDVLSDIVLLAQVEELSDLAGSLGAQSSGDVLIGKPFDFLISLLDDD